MKNPIPLTRSFSAELIMPPSESYSPTVDLNRVKGLESLPEEGEIRFRYSRIRQSTTEDETGTHYSCTLKLKSITDICDCEGKDEENNEPERAEKVNADEALDSLMEELDVEELENMEDESEDDNPEKY